MTLLYTGYKFGLDENTLEVYTADRLGIRWSVRRIHRAIDPVISRGVGRRGIGSRAV